MPPNESPIRAELDWVGASFRKAGAADYITATEDDDPVRLVGPPREHPRRSWLGPEWQLLELLAALPDDAGVQAVCCASSCFSLARRERLRQRMDGGGIRRSHVLTGLDVRPWTKATIRSRCRFGSRLHSV
jgi:hypothetical protein